MRVIDLLGGTEMMTQSDCRELLAHSRIGRLATVADGVPDIVPVNYRLDGADIIVETNVGHKLLAASEAVVAFEVDSIDEAHRLASSVVVHGRARAELGARHGDPVAWSGPKDFVIRIVPTSVTGRRITGSRPA
jgi:hypothetical protein